MVLKLDPGIPLVWRTPDALQLGIDQPVAVIDNVTGSAQKMLAALVGGITRPGLSMIGTATGAVEAEVEALLRSVGAALVDSGESPGTGAAGHRAAAHRVAIDGDGPTARQIGALVHANGPEMCWGAADTVPAPVDLAVIVAHFAIPPDRYGGWLRRDIPHLPVVFGDRLIRIGPLVEPGVGPCLYCVEKARADVDPAWPAIASQLLGRTAPSETLLTSAETAARTARIVLRALSGAADEFIATSLALDAATGLVSVVTHRPHADCGCRVLPGNVTVLDPARAAGRSGTRTFSAGGALG